MYTPELDNSELDTAELGLCCLAGPLVCIMLSVPLLRVVNPRLGRFDEPGGLVICILHSLSLFDSQLLIIILCGHDLGREPLEKVTISATSFDVSALFGWCITAAAQQMSWFTNCHIIITVNYNYHAHRFVSHAYCFCCQFLAREYGVMLHSV
jgi:hypothetical protein